MKIYKKFLVLISVSVILFSLTSCSRINIFKTKNSHTNDKEISSPIKKKFKTIMVTDTGGLGDNGINKLSWEGLKAYSEKTGNEIEYLESGPASYYEDSIRKVIKNVLKKESGLVWGIGYPLGKTIEKLAMEHPDKNFANIDWVYGTDKNAESYEISENLTGVFFKSEQASFLVGYIAGLTTKTNRVGFVGGLKGAISDQYEYGFRSGLMEAQKDLKKEIQIDIDYIDSFEDMNKAKDLAHKMYAKGVDIIFSAAARANLGVLDAARQEGKYIIGQDVDISYLSPKNVLTSALKKVDVAIDDITTRFALGENIGGKNFLLGLKEGAGGIPNLPDEVGLISKEVYSKALDKQSDIINGKIFVPFSEETWQIYLK